MDAREGRQKSKDRRIALPHPGQLEHLFGHRQGCGHEGSQVLGIFQPMPALSDGDLSLFITHEGIGAPGCYLLPQDPAAVAKGHDDGRVTGIRVDLPLVKDAVLRGIQGVGGTGGVLHEALEAVADRDGAAYRRAPLAQLARQGILLRVRVLGSAGPETEAGGQ